MTAKFDWSKVSEQDEDELRTTYNKLDKKRDYDAEDQDIILKTFSEMVEETGMEKTERAYLIFHNSHKGFSIGQLCAAFGISQSYFRELRQTHLRAWEQRRADHDDDNFRFAIEAANDPNFLDKEWVDYYGEKWNRELFRGPKSPMTSEGLKSI